jgi:hypothetical protein
VARSAAKGSTTRIYAPRPFTPPTALLQDPTMAFPAPGFKKPSLPFSKSFDDAASGQGSVETNARPGQPASNSDIAAPKPFRPMSCRPQDEIGAATARRPPPHQSFFGNSQFSFDSVASNPNLDDSGYFSTSMSEQNVNEGDRLAGASASRSDAVRPTAPGNEVQVQATRGVNMRAPAALNTDFDATFANQTKRIRPTSPGDREEDVVLGTRPHELSKRPCVRRSPLRSHGSPSQATALGTVFPGGTQTFILPPNVPHPTAIGDFPGLEFSDADLGRYAELYEKGAERWSRSTMEEWLSGATDIMAKFTEIMNLVSFSFSSCLGPSGWCSDRFPFSLRRSRST